MLVLWRGPKKIKYGAAFSRNFNIIIRGALMVNPKNLAFFAPRTRTDSDFRLARRVSQNLNI
jgi:hypothetical protein